MTDAAFFADSPLPKREGPFRTVWLPSLLLGLYMLTACDSDPEGTSTTAGDSMISGPEATGGQSATPSNPDEAGQATGSGSQPLAGTREEQVSGMGGKDGAANNPTGGSFNPGGSGGAGAGGMNDAGGSVAGGSGGTGNAGTNQADGSAEAGSVASNETKTLIPHESWTCNMPDGIVPPQSGAFVFEADYEVGEVHDLGETQYGHRHQIDIVGGTVNGSEIQGDILTGGLDYQLKLSNGALEIEQINVIRTRDGALIYFRNCGTAADEASEVRMVPDFEAPNASPYAWLNSATIVGIREFDMANKKLKVRFFDVSGVVPGSETVRVTKPEGFPNQTWECKKSSGIQGAVVYTETVRIGASLAIGASKYGTRNVIPITGGTTSGGITGEVLVGGGDYQILSPTFEIDARYTLRTNDGELIIVRNCGPLGGLIPVFETRKDGPYAWLNQGDYRSSNPSISIGAVILTIYEAR